MKGGILIVGSLLWDQDELRQTWRSQSLDIDAKINVSAPIRYGRVSSGRSDNYTMVFSEECKANDKLGLASFVPFTQKELTYELLMEEVTELIKSERKLEALANKRLNWDWGCVGLLVNPKRLVDDKTGSLKKLDSSWKQNFGKDFKPQEYRVGEEHPILNQEGKFLFDWPDNLGEYDFLIATATKPKLEAYPSAEMIVEAMKKSQDHSYFSGNINNGIHTFQDEGITELLTDGAS